MQSNYQNYVAYQEAALKLLAEQGFEPTAETQALVFDHWLRGTEVSDIPRRSKDNRLSNEEKLNYVKEEIERMLARTEEIRISVMGLIQSESDVLARSGIAAEKAEVLISAFNKGREYKQVLGWFANMTRDGVDPVQQYILAENSAIRSLASSASGVDSYSTSAQANLERRAQVSAKAEIVDAFASLANS